MRDRNRFVAAVMVVVFTVSTWAPYLSRAQQRKPPAPSQPPASQAQRLPVGAPVSAAPGNTGAGEPSGTYAIIASGFPLKVNVSGSGASLSATLTSGAGTERLDNVKWIAKMNVLRFRRSVLGWFEWYRGGISGRSFSGKFSHGKSPDKPKSWALYQFAFVADVGAGAPAAPVVALPGPEGTWIFNAAGRQLGIKVSPSGNGYAATLVFGARADEVRDFDQVTWDAAKRKLKLRRQGPGWYEWFKGTVSGSTIKGTLSHETTADLPAKDKFKLTFTGRNDALAAKALEAQLSSIRAAAYANAAQASGGLKSGDRCTLRPGAPNGYGNLRDIFDIKADYEVAVDRGEEVPGKKFPDKDDDDATKRKFILPESALAQYKCILPDLQKHMNFIWEAVINRQGQRPSDADLVATTFQYGCKQVSRYMPGYARIVKVRIPTEPDTSGDWDAPFEPPKEEKRPKDGNVKPAVEYKEPKQKEEVIEVCSITHVQLEGTLNKDLGLLIKQKGFQKAGGDPTPPRAVGGGGKISKEDLTALAKNYSWLVKLPDGKGLDDNRPLDVNGLCKQYGLDGTLTNESIETRDRFIAKQAEGRKAMEAKQDPTGFWKFSWLASAGWRGVQMTSNVAITTAGSGYAGRIESKSAYGRFNVALKNPTFDPKTKELTFIVPGPPSNIFACTIDKGVCTGRFANGENKSWLNPGPFNRPQSFTMKLNVGVDVDAKPPEARLGGGWLCKTKHTVYQKIDPPERPNCVPAALFGQELSTPMWLEWARKRAEEVPKIEAFWKTNPGALYTTGSGVARVVASPWYTYKGPVLCKLHLDSACNKTYQKQLAVPMRAVVDGKHYACQPSAQARADKASDVLLNGDLGDYNETLRGENLFVIADKLTGFFRKGASARNFAQALRFHQQKLKIRVEAAPDAARNEIVEQNKGAEMRGNRENLRRQVDQWTDAYEYGEMTDYIQKPAFTRNGQRLIDVYKLAETFEAYDFWSECKELAGGICMAPKLPEEIAACKACAEKALREHCIAGKDSSTGNCKGETVVHHYAHDDWKQSTSSYGGNTLFNWILVNMINESGDERFHNGDRVANTATYKRDLAREIALTKFLGVQNRDDRLLSSEGRDYFNALQISKWQRCYLFNPWFKKNPNYCNIAVKDDSTGRSGIGTIDQWIITKGFLGNNTFEDVENAWEQARMFEMVLEHPAMQSAISWNQHPQHILAGCNAKQNCTKAGQDAKDAMAKRFNDGETEILKDAGQLANQQGDATTQSAGGGFEEVIMPIIGKILGLLINAAGIGDMMKQLGKAAGLTPEQGADCEDPEYRADVMKLNAPSNKRDCLTKVFAKNFVNVLESIIVMLGNKLVDWAVDLLRQALQGVKSALLASAGSVPFAGGFLATLVDICWELLFNFGLKMVLKMFVVAKLPEWLQVRKLANLPIEAFFNNVVVRVIMGIILEVIEAAITYGNKSWVAVGFDSILKAIKFGLEQMNPPPYFWIRAFTFASKELAKSDKAGEKASIEDQLKEFAKALIAGFGTAIGTGMRAEMRDRFMQKVEEIKQLIDDFGQLKEKLMSNPVGTIVDIIATKLGPLVVPIIATFVKMPTWLEDFLMRFTNELDTTVTAIKNKKLDAKKLVGSIATVIEPLGKLLLGRIQFGDDDLKKMLIGDDGLYDKIIFILQNLDTLEEQYFKQPWRTVGAVVSTVRAYVSAKVRALIPGTLSAEQDLVGGVLDRAFDILSKQDVRDALFSNVSVKTILAEAARLLAPYLKARLGAVAANLGIEGVIGKVVDWLLGENGPLQDGQRLTGWLQTNGQTALADVIDAFTTMIEAQAGKGGPIVAALAKGLLQAVRDVLRAPGGFAGVVKNGVGGLLLIAKNAFMPLVGALVPGLGGGAQESALGMLLRSVLGGVTDLFKDPRAFIAQPAETLKALADKIVVALKAMATSMLPDGVQLPDLSGKSATDIVLLGLRAVTPFVLGFLEKAGGGGAVGSFIKSVLDDIGDVVRDPRKLQSLLALSTGQAFAKIAERVRPLIEGLARSLFQDGAARSLAQSAMGVVLDFGQSAVGGKDAAQAARDALAAVVAAGGEFVGKKLTGLFTDRMVTLRGVVKSGFESLVRLVGDVVKGGKAWTELTQGGAGDLLGRFLSGVLPLVTKPIRSAITDPKVAGLVVGLIETIVPIVQDLAKPTSVLRAMGSNWQAGLDFIFGQISAPVESFLKYVISSQVPGGIAQQIVQLLADVGLGFLKKPSSMISLVQRIKGGDYKSLLKDAVGGLVDRLLKGAGLGDTLKNVLDTALRFLLDKLLDGNTARLTVRSGARGG
jgi:hypothetical protein